MRPNFSLLRRVFAINQLVEAIRIPAGQLSENTNNMGEGTVNQVGSGGVKTRKTGRHDGKHCQTRDTYSFSCPFLLPDDLLHLVVDISLYCMQYSQ